MEYVITQLKGGTDNCYLVAKGNEAILVDTSSGPSLQMVMDACRRYEMKLLVLTHPHFDHAENADVIAKRFGIPVAYHEADDEIFDNYDAQALKSYGLVGFVVLKMSLKVLRETKVVRPAEHFFVREGDSFGEFGFPDVRVVELPGHTKGSIGVVVGGSSEGGASGSSSAVGDGEVSGSGASGSGVVSSGNGASGGCELIVGDALDNWIRPGMGHLYYDLDVQKKTYEKIRAMNVRKVYYGHGKPTEWK